MSIACSLCPRLPLLSVVYVSCEEKKIAQTPQDFRLSNMYISCEEKKIAHTLQNFRLSKWNTGFGTKDKQWKKL